MAASPTAVSQPAVTNPGLEVQGRAIDDLIRSRAPGSPMIGLGSAFVRYGNAMNVDPAVLVGLAGAETSFGTAGAGRPPTRGAFGIKTNGVYRTYSSYEDAIRDAAALLSGPLYYGEGRYTLERIIPKYSPASDGNKVSQHIQNIATIAAAVRRGFTPATDIRVIGGESGRTTLGDLIGDAAGSVKDAVASPIAGIIEVVKFLLDPKLWLRIGTMILGVIGMVLGAIFMFRGSGNSARPVGLLIVLFGFGWLWAGIANINPIQLVKDVVKG